MLDADDLLNDGDDEDMLQLQKDAGSDSEILNMLDEDIDDDEDVPALFTTPTNRNFN